MKDDSQMLNKCTTNMTSVVFNDIGNDTQICYHLMFPKSFDLKKRQRNSAIARAKIVESTRRRRGRPRKEDSKKYEDERNVEENDDNERRERSVALPCSRTRYGRVSRPPKHMSKFIDIKEQKIANNDVTPTITIMDLTSSSKLERVSNSISTAQEAIITNAPKAKKIRKNIDRFTCGVCKKVYLGKKKMLKHHLAFPDHRTNDASEHVPKTNSSLFNSDSYDASIKNVDSFLFDELMKYVGNATRTERMHIFLAELTNFICKIKALKPNLVSSAKPSSPENSVFYINKYISKVFDIKEGNARLNAKIFEKQSESDEVKMDTDILNEASTNGIPPLENIPPLEYNLNIFPLPQINYDHISDNAVEASALTTKIHHEKGSINEIAPESPILDIPLDLFPFTNLK